MLTNYQNNSFQDKGFDFDLFFNDNDALTIESSSIIQKPWSFQISDMFADPYTELINDDYKLSMTSPTDVIQSMNPIKENHFESILTFQTDSPRSDGTFLKKMSFEEHVSKAEEDIKKSDHEEEIEECMISAKACNRSLNKTIKAICYEIEDINNKICKTKLNQNAEQKEQNSNKKGLKRQGKNFLKEENQEVVATIVVEKSAAKPRTKGGRKLKLNLDSEVERVCQSLIMSPVKKRVREDSIATCSGSSFKLGKFSFDLDL